MLELVVVSVFFIKCSQEAEARGRSKAWGVLAGVLYVAVELVAVLIASRMGLGILAAFPIGLALGALSAYQVVRHVRTLPDRFQTA